MIRFDLILDSVLLDESLVSFGDELADAPLVVDVERCPFGDRLRVIGENNGHVHILPDSADL
jgi:hypothetical protein